MKVINLFLAGGLSLLISSFISNLVGLFNISSALIVFLIVAVLAIILLVIGFFLSEKQVLSSGFLGSGVILILFSSLIASISKFTSAVSMLSSGSLLGKASASTEAIPYLNLLFLAIGIIVFIILAVKSEEKN